jgi:hypothetical protein
MSLRNKISTMKPYILKTQEDIEEVIRLYKEGNAVAVSYKESDPVLAEELSKRVNEMNMKSVRRSSKIEVNK